MNSKPSKALIKHYNVYFLVVNGLTNRSQNF